MQHSRYGVLAGIACVLTVACATPVFANEDSLTTTPPPPSEIKALAGKKFDMQGFIREWRMRHGSTTASTTSAAGRRFGDRIASVDASCAQKTMDTREVAIQAAWTAFNTSINTALVARQTALYDAWGASSTERTSALKTAWSVWKEAHKTAFKTLKSARNAAWKTYKTTMTAECKVNVPGEERLLSDTSGSVSL